MPRSRYHVAVIGLAHMHVNELMRRFAELPDVEMVAVADTGKPELNQSSPSTRAHTLSVAQSEIGISHTYADYRELLEREKPDIVLLCPELSKTAGIGEVVASHGAHIVTEKPLTASLADAHRLVRATRAAGVLLMVNWPSAWSGALRRMHQLVQAGEAGDVLQVHTRMGSGGPFATGAAHPGVRDLVTPLNEAEKAATWWYDAALGGGAYLDYCCYGAALACWFFGKPPEFAFGVRANLASRFGTADDTGILVMEFDTGVALAEATWNSVDLGGLYGPVVYGSTATLSVDHGSANGRVRVSYGGDVVSFTDPLEFPAHRATLALEFVHHLKTGEPLHPLLDPAFNLQVMAAIDAGIRAADTGLRQRVADVTL
ncbi:MAG: Gfo/Idh/MocA family oxidoreductase [Chloroflexota bacterium]|nr:Gfo/Idh/MocA family oxidoreductase [Chloroflexota bacterium]